MVTQELISLFIDTRQKSVRLCSPLLVEDYGIQGMEDVSPPKWNLAHTTWFFETAILKKYHPNYQPFNPLFHHLFNSYYQTLGTPFARPQRGLLSRPSVNEIYTYRQAIDEQLLIILENKLGTDKELVDLLILGINHEQQHQELLLMDVKYNLSLNLDYPTYKTKKTTISHEQPLEFLEVKGGIAEIGALNQDEFCFDNELPQHKKWIDDFYIADRLVTNREYLQFINDGGYQQSIYWLADGWDWRVKQAIEQPLYWQKPSIDNAWSEFTLHGLEHLDLCKPVCHLSFYEADAYARWLNCRLPTEEEWEHFAIQNNVQTDSSNFLEQEFLDPISIQSSNNCAPYQVLGDVWEWTSSAYVPYPRFKPFAGFLGEYNGKFMNNQRVLRGGSCVTPLSHIRISYRNFFQADKRWAFTGLRLAKDSI